MKVEDGYRTHPDSHIPGGTSVKIQYFTESEPREYDKIKNPKWYIETALSNHPGEIETVHLLKDHDWVLVWANVNEL